MNSFVQERVTGIKILQLFNRRKLNPRNSRKSTISTKKHGSKQLYNSSFQLPILSPRWPWFYYLYGGIKILNGDNFTTLEIYFPIQCL
jgi:hypothetical protein